jgi:hypothetical protein
MVAFSVFVYKVILPRVEEAEEKFDRKQKAYERKLECLNNKDKKK